MADYDVVVIGAGLGGLSAGAQLAKAGRTVVVLEQSDFIAAPPSSRRASGSIWGRPS